MNVLVIGGGQSAERDISLLSSKAVFDAVKQNGHSVEYYDWDNTKDWILENASSFDVILPIVHGAGGEDGVLQSILEDTTIPFLGSDSASSRLCFNKVSCIELLIANGIKTPMGSLMNYDEYSKSEFFNMPHVLKPFDEGSSIDTLIYADPATKDLRDIKDAYSRHEKLLVEEFIKGIEITVPILDGIKLPTIEIVPPQNEFFDYANKYNGKTTENIPPTNLSSEIQENAIALAQSVHDITGCRHISRTDMIVRGDELVVLEINTLPGMTNQSLFPKAAEYAGLSFKQFVEHLINLTTGKS